MNIKNNMEINEHEFNEYGYASIEPRDDVVAGSYGTWTIMYVVGQKGISRGGSLKITTDSDTDWGTPQFTEPQDENYINVFTTGKATLATIVEQKTIKITIVRGSLHKEEKICIILGDKSSGSIGSRAQTFIEDPHNFIVFIDSSGSGKYIELANSPKLKIIGGPPDRFVVISPSIVHVNEQSYVVVKAEDKWGNPSCSFRGEIQFISSDPDVSMPPPYKFTKKDKGIHRFNDLKFCNEGTYRILVKDTETGIESYSNPILCTSNRDNYKLFWGDLHGQVNSSDKINKYFEYARDVSIIDFCGFQKNDHNITNEDWSIQQRNEKKFNNPGKFITIPGYEWSPTTPNGGHHNVYYPVDDQPIIRSSNLKIKDKPDNNTIAQNITELYQTFKNKEVIFVRHVGGKKGNLSFNDPKLETAIEITSTHGTFEWYLNEALEKGYKMGVVAGGDGYTGRPGGEFPGFNDRRYSKSGLTAIFSKNLTRSGLWEAFKNKRIYGTTGARIIILFEADTHNIGEEYTTRNPPKFRCIVEGTEPIEKIELINNSQIIYSHPINNNYCKNKMRITWDGASRNESFSGIVWDGEIELQDGKLTSAQKIRFDSPRSNISEISECGIKWHSVTCGYTSGLIIDLAINEKTKLKTIVQSKLISRPEFGDNKNRRSLISYSDAENIECCFKPSELEEEPIICNIGVLNRKITFSKGPSDQGSKNQSFEYIDHTIKPGLNSYYVRITQIDMEKAWSSPIFINYVR